MDEDGRYLGIRPVGAEHYTTVVNVPKQMAFYSVLAMLHDRLIFPPGYSWMEGELTKAEFETHYAFGTPAFKIWVRDPDYPVYFTSNLDLQRVH